MSELNPVIEIPSEEMVPFGSKPVSDAEGYFILAFGIVVVLILWGSVVNIILKDINKNRF